MSKSTKINTDILNNLIFGRVEPHIYAFSTETVPNYLKIGDTYRPLETRLNEWRKHFPNLEKKFESEAKVDDQTFFRDHAVHHFLENNIEKSRLERDTIDNVPYYSNEFFKDTTEEDIQEAIKDVKNCYKNNDSKYQYYSFDESHIPIAHTYRRTEDYSPRPNQQKTIDRFNEAINMGQSNLLMYAVMRFGKSFTSMCCAVEMNAKLVIVVSAKADVKEEWKKTVESHVKFEGYSFLDSNSLLQSDTILTDKISAKEKTVLFLTLQDLQGDTIKSKHKEVFENQIDLLLIDETHFGARATEYGKVLKDSNFTTKEIKNELKLNDNTIDELDTTTKFINAKVRIHLSGTPYRILMNSEFTNDDIIAFYQFSNIADDQEKWDLENLNKDEIKEWDNPYYGFPQMIRFAFNPNESSRRKMEEMKKNGVTYAFSALFKPKSIAKDNENNFHKKFNHEQEIIDLLNVIDGSQTDENLLSFLDYDKIKGGKMCRHIVCVLPYRASCDALEELINTNEFKNLSSYELINISGVDNDKNYKDTQSVQSKIKKCESENIKTITLTVNRMLTGSTVPQWDTMLYLKDTASPQEYDQAIFRLQNQYIRTYKEPNGDVVKYNMKPQTLLVDFNPNRMFQMQEHKSQIYNVNTESNGNNKLEDRIRRELEISPIVVLNNDKIVQIKPADILDAIRKYSSDRSVFDEATTISIDYSLLDIDEIRAEIEKQGEIGSRQGIEIKPSEGEGDEIDIKDEPENDKKTEENKDKADASEVETEMDYKAKFAMYYARILFFAFLTDSRVKSLQEIINEIENNANNLRIATNIDLDKAILSLFQRHINPFILSELDYKIHNVNSLANDPSLKPIERASNAMKKFSRLSDSEIVTPAIVTNKIISTLPSDAIDESTIFLDIAAKQGEFAYATYKKYSKTIADNFYSVPTSKIAYEFTRKVYSLLELDINHIEKNYTSYDLIKENELTVDSDLKFNNKKMKFDVIVGNPPYQDKGGAGGTSDASIFQHFCEMATKISSQCVSLIIPARWFAGGRENLVGDFRKNMLNNDHIQKLTAYTNSKELFRNVEVKGGLCYYLENKNYNGKCEYTLHRDGTIQNSKIQLNKFDIFIREPKLLVIVDKVKSKNKLGTVDKIISSNTPFGIPTNPKTSKKTPFKVYEKKSINSDISLHHIEKNKRKIEYVDKNDIQKNQIDVDKPKVFIPDGYGAGESFPHQILGVPELAQKNSVCSQSYLYSAFETEKEAKHFMSYIKTRFLRALVSAIKITQSAPNRTYRFVPLQDFTSESDIDWSKSIEEIDSELYKKYNLTKEEIEFIEAMIKPMV